MASTGTFQMTSVAFDTTVPGVDRRRGHVRRGAQSRRRRTRDAGRNRGAADARPRAVDARRDARPRHFGPLRIEARTETAAVTRVAVTAPDLGATLGGTVDLEGTRVFNLTARIDSRRLAAGRRYPWCRARARRDDARGQCHRPAHAAGPRVARRHDPEARRAPWLASIATGRRDDDGRRAGRAHVATPTPLLPLAVQAGSRLSYRPDLLTLSDVVVTSGNTKVAADGIFGSPDDVVAARRAPDGWRTCARCCSRCRRPGGRTWCSKGRPA